MRTVESILEELKNNNVNSITDFRKKLRSTYTWVCRRPVIYEQVLSQSNLERTKAANNTWNLETVATEAAKYNYRKDFQDGSKGAYLYALRNKLLDSVCKHMTAKPFIQPSKRGKRAHNFKDMVGRTFGKHTVESQAPTDGKWSMVNCKCECGTISTIRAANLRNGGSTKCLKCSNQVSKPQREIYEYIVSLGFDDAILSCRDYGKEIDIVIPSKNFAVEYDGLIWHSDALDKTRHTEQTENARREFFRSTGLSCFRIFEDEYKNSKELVLAMIRQRLMGTKEKQEFEYKVIADPKQHKAFFERNHLDGWGTCEVAFGAFRGDQLISCLSLRKYRLGQHKGMFEISRFCSDFTKPSYGAFSKLLKLAKKYCKDNGVSTLLSASDNRYGSGNVYKNNGFKLIPGSDKRLNYYYYLHSKGIRIHRFTCKKLSPPTITLEQLAEYPTESAQTYSGLTAFIKFGKWEPLYKVYGWGNKLWRMDLK